VIAPLLAFSVPKFTDRREKASVVSAELEHPSPENEAALRREAAKTKSIALKFDLVVAGSLFVVLNATLSLVSPWRKPAA
jgi:hypothetical protein